jgi:hypothetical protein
MVRVFTGKHEEIPQPFSLKLPDEEEVSVGEADISDHWGAEYR